MLMTDLPRLVIAIVFQFSPVVFMILCIRIKCYSLIVKLFCFIGIFKIQGVLHSILLLHGDHSCSNLIFSHF